MPKISSYPNNQDPDSEFEFVGTDPENEGQSSSGSTETVTLATLRSEFLPMPTGGTYPGGSTEYLRADQTWAVPPGTGGGGGGGASVWKDLVETYEADPTGTTSASTALATACAAAVTAQPAPFGLTVPPGTFLLTSSQDLPYNMILQGAGANGGTVSGQRTGSWFNVSSSFSGTYVFGFKDVPAPSSFTGVNGCLASGIGIYGGIQTGSAVNGLYIVGPTITTLRYISISQMTGWAVASGTDPSANEQFDFAQNWFRVQADSCGTVSGGGFQLNGCEDSSFINCYSIGNNNGPGFYVNGCDNTKFIGCNSEWNSGSTGYGWYFTGDWQYFTGGCTMTGCSTDANAVAGVMIDATWTTGGGAGTGPGIIQIGDCHFRRDGQANGTTTAGIYIGATTLPVIINGFSTMPSIGDSGGSVYTPAYGVYFSQSTYAQPILLANGLAWGNTAAYRTNATNNTFPTLTTGATANILKAHGPNSSPTYGS